MNYGRDNWVEKVMSLAWLHLPTVAWTRLKYMKPLSHDSFKVVVVFYFSSHLFILSLPVSHFFLIYVAKMSDIVPNRHNIVQI